MDKLLKVILTLFLIYLFYNAIAFMFDFQAITFPWLNHEIMMEYRVRVLVPTLLLTVTYFLVRYFTGKSLTSTLWPVYVTLCAWLISNISAILWVPNKLPLYIAIILNTFMIIIVRSAHNKRKNEIF
jgi:hypothetical protein